MKKALLNFNFSNNQEKKLKKNKGKFSAIKDGVSELKTADEENITILKDSCKSLKIKGIETTFDEFVNNFLLAKDWCSIEQQ